MNSPKKLIAKANTLFDKKQYQEVVDLLTDEELLKFNDPGLRKLRSTAESNLKAIAILNVAYIFLTNRDYNNALIQFNKAVILNPNYEDAYIGRGNVAFAKKEFDGALSDYEKAIELNPNNEVYFYNKGLALYGKGDFDKAIENFSRSIDTNSDYELPYIERGNCWYMKGEYDKALTDYNSALKINENNPISINNKGLILFNKGEYDQALESFNKAIQLKPDYADAYNAIGLVWYAKADYDKALVNYEKAIELNPDFTNAYLDIGNIWYTKGKFEDAIEDYNKVLDLSTDAQIKTSAYLNRGNCWYMLKEFQLALSDYETVLKIEPNNSNALYWIDQINGSLGNKIESDPKKKDSLFYKVTNAIDQINNEIIKTDVHKLYFNDIQPCMLELTKYTSKIDDEFWDKDVYGKPVRLLAHYSNLVVADIITEFDPIAETNERNLRYSNAVFLNDPEEGKTFIEFLDMLDDPKYVKGKKTSIKEAFYNCRTEEENNIYIGSFLPVKDDHEDELLMWRTYGKDENQNEAAGCCMVIDYDFFDKTEGMDVAKSSDKDTSSLLNKHPLYKVIYINKKNGRIEDDENDLIKNELRKLKISLENVLLKKSDYDTKDNNTIDRIIFFCLSELRYFFKSTDFAYENELRVIHFSTDDKIIRIDENASILPRKLFILSNKDVKPHLKKLVLGPKVRYPERWIYLETRMKRSNYKDFKIMYSNCKLQ